MGGWNKHVMIDGVMGDNGVVSGWWGGMGQQSCRQKKGLAGASQGLES